MFAGTIHTLPLRARTTTGDSVNTVMLVAAVTLATAMPPLTTAAATPSWYTPGASLARAHTIAARKR